MNVLSDINQRLLPGDYWLSHQPLLQFINSSWIQHSAYNSSKYVIGTFPFWFPLSPIIQSLSLSIPSLLYTMITYKKTFIIWFCYEFGNGTTTIHKLTLASCCRNIHFSWAEGCKYSETCLKRTPLGPLWISVCFRQVKFMRLWPVKWYFGTKYLLRFRQVSALEHVRFRQVLLPYTKV